MICLENQNPNLHKKWYKLNSWQRKYLCYYIKIWRTRVCALNVFSWKVLLSILRPHCVFLSSVRPTCVLLSLVCPHCVFLSSVRPHCVFLFLLRPHCVFLSLVRSLCVFLSLVRPHCVFLSLVRSLCVFLSYKTWVFNLLNPDTTPQFMTTRPPPSFIDSSCPNSPPPGPLPIIIPLAISAHVSWIEFLKLFRFGIFKMN